MKVMYVNSAGQKIKPMQLANKICKTKKIPSDVLKSTADAVLLNKSAKLTLSTLLSIAGIASAFALMVDSVDNNSLVETISAMALGFVSTVTGIYSSLKNKIVRDARDIINGRKELYY